MFKFFHTEKKSSLTFDIGALGADMHSHLLPGIDDGAKSMEDSIALIRALMDLGYKSLVTTPHIMSEVYPNTSEIILGKLDLVRSKIKELGIEVEISAAAEYFMDDSFLKSLKEERLLTIFEDYLLVETSFMFAPVNLFDYFFQIELQGYKPIFAHPERYNYYHDNYGIYKEIKERGIKLQLNILSLTGYYGEPVKKIAVQLLKDNLINFIGTDTHHTRHINALKKLSTDPQTYKILLNYEFDNHLIK
jgi:protein-tyrosine phosphatase